MLNLRWLRAIPTVTLKTMKDDDGQSIIAREMRRRSKRRKAVKMYEKIS